MQEYGKHSYTAILAADLRAVFAVMKTRRTKLFAYGFAFALVAYTAYLAFNPSGNAASPWLNNLFTSASSSASAAPYRSQMDSVISYIFPNSSSPSPETFGARNSTGRGVGSLGNGAPVADGSGKGVGSQNDGKSKTGLLGDGVSGKNQTEKVMGSPQNGVLGKKDGVLAAKNQTGSAVGLLGNGVAGKNQTAKGASSGGSGVSAKDPAKEGVGSKKDGVLGGKNQTRSGVGLQGSRIPKRNQSGRAVSRSGGEGASAANSETGAGSASKGNGVSTNTQMENGENGVSAVKNETVKGVGLKENGASTNSQKKSRAKPQENDVSAKGVVAGPKISETSAKAEPKATVAEAKVSNLTSSLTKGNGSGASASNHGGGKREEWIKAMKGCDIFQGRWVKDNSYPLYPQGSCPHIDEPFDCYLNGRPDRAYQKLRWQPNGCNIPRLNATDMLDVLRGKRLVFVGDSLNRNMWESLVCVLRHSVKDKSKVFEASGRLEFRTEGSYSFLFTDYNCSVEFFRSPFLVREWEMPERSGKTKETLRLDLIEQSSSKYKDADVIVFNTGHWWTHEKTSKGKDYYQEGNRVYGELNVIEAFHKALNTWAKWVDANVNPKKTLVFFRGYSASHFSGGQWNSGGQCDNETEPIKNEKFLSSYPPKMSVLEMVIKGMKTPVSYLNITRMTDYRKDAHPSIYRKQNMSEEERRSPERYQDCSHWCLPGVPDSWNELLYAQILINQHQLLQ